MVRHPAVFLMDEPLSNLDAKLRVQMRAEIIALHRRLGVTFVYVTHDQAEAMTMSDRVAVMMGGELLQVEPTGAALSRPAGPAGRRDDRQPEDQRGFLRRLDISGCARFLQAFMATRRTSRFVQRPSRIAASGDGKLNGVVASVENLGSDIFLNVALGDGRGTVVVRTHPDVSRSEPGRPVGLQIDPACLLQFDGAGMRQRHAEQVEAAA